MYSITFANANEAHQVSRFFDTKHAATSWFRWLTTLSYPVSVKMYKGQPGAMLVKEWSR